MSANKTVFFQLVQLMQRLRAKNGCPWDRKQTHTSLRPFLLEETHEVLEAIRSRKPQHLQDELGDLLFQVIFHAQIASEAGQFDINDVIQTSLDKMTRRHPHIFGKEKLHTSNQVLENWEEIKRRERKGSGKSLLAGVPRSLPALVRAHRVQAKAARVGFTWSSIDQALAKVQEELQELKAALQLKKPARISEEMGDVFFALVNLARFAEANPEDALHQAVAKFIRRFGRIEKISKKTNRALSDFSQAELLQLWNLAKSQTNPQAAGVRIRHGKPHPRPPAPAAPNDPNRSKSNPRGRRR